MKNSIIYKHTNKINNKSYIGKTIFSMEERLAGHIKSSRNGSEYAFHRALRKYGVDNFTSEILESDIEESIISEREKYWIKKYKSFGKLGYNMTIGGEGTQGIKVKESTKEKLREYAIKAYNKEGKIVSVSKETFNKDDNLIHINTGRTKTKEQKLNNAKANYIKFNVYDSNNKLMFINDGDLKTFWKETGLPQQIIHHSKDNRLYSKTPNNIIARLKKSGNYKYKGWYIERLK